MQALIVYDSNKVASTKWKAQLIAWQKAFARAGVKLLPCSTATVLTYLKKYANYISFCFIWNRDAYLTETIESLGVACFNASWAIRSANDKLLLREKLAMNDIPSPIIAKLPYCDGDNILKCYSAVVNSIYETGIRYPFLIRSRFSNDNDVSYLIKNSDELKKVLYSVGHRRLVAQQYISPGNADYLVSVVNGNALAVVKRYHESTFTKDGLVKGKIEYRKPSIDIKSIGAIAAKAARAFRADYAAVSVGISKFGQVFVQNIDTSANSLVVEATTNFSLTVKVASSIKKKVLDRQDELDIIANGI